MKYLLPTFLLLFLAVASYSQTAVVIGDNAYLRGTPADDGAVVDTLAPAATVSIIKKQGSWFLVQSSPFVGWMHGDSIRLVSAPAVDSRPVSSVATSSAPDGNSRSAAAASSAAKESMAAPGESAKREYLQGPFGGCYYIKPGGRKSYVDHAFCKPKPADGQAVR